MQSASKTVDHSGALLAHAICSPSCIAPLEQWPNRRLSQSMLYMHIANGLSRGGQVISSMMCRFSYEGGQLLNRFTSSHWGSVAAGVPDQADLEEAHIAARILPHDASCQAAVLVHR